MGKKTGSSAQKRYTYVSFRDRIDSIQIAPSLNLTKKSFHDAEISHFLSTFEHWKETNLSSNFQNFVEIIEPKCLSLPQLIFYKDDIFNTIETYLKLNDELCLQPVLELLSQFIHDLGEDFILHENQDYYTRTLNILKTLSLTQKNSDPLEWIFNTLTYIFKYLSKVLSNDLLPTFKILLPLLTQKKKEYIARFTSQALSFLIRKSNSNSLIKLVENLSVEIKNFDELNEFNKKEFSVSSFKYSLSIIFSESIENSSGTLYSRTNAILTPLLKTFILNVDSTSVLNDVLINIISHSNDSKIAEQIYLLALSSSDKLLQDEEIILSIDNLISINQLLTTLIFSESGRKFSDKLYPDFFTTIKNLINYYNNNLENKNNSISINNFGDSIVQLYSLIFRNINDESILIKNHIFLFDSLISLNNSKHFLPFLNLSLDLTSNEKLLSLYSKEYLISFINNNWQQNYLQISFFLNKLNEKNLINLINTNFIIIPLEFKKFIIDDISKQSDIELYWRLTILKFLSNSIKVDNSIVLQLLNNLTSDEIMNNFKIDLISELITLFSIQNFNDKDSQLLFKTIFGNNTLTNLKNYFQNNNFITSMLNIFKKISIGTDSDFQNTLNYFNKDDLFKKLIELTIDNFKTNSNKLREASFNFVISFYSLMDIPLSEKINQCRIIEQIPLSLQSGRDIQIRFRDLAKKIKTDSKDLDKLQKKIISNFIFGQLQNKFQPSWQIVFECIPDIITKIDIPVWEICSFFITLDYENQTLLSYYDDISLDSETEFSDRDIWTPLDKRLLSNYEACNNLCNNYNDIKNSLISFSESKLEKIEFNEFIRTQTIKLLIKIPSLAERNFKVILPYIIDENIDEIEDEVDQDEDDENAKIIDKNSPLKNWSSNDRNLLIELLTHFSKLNKVSKADLVFEYLLKLLSNRATKVQVLALNCLLNWHNPVYNKYKDNLKNLLDNTLFRDEVILFLQSNDENIIEDKDLDVLMPIVLRILFGRAQTLKTSGNKQGMRNAGIKVLSNLKDKYINEFLKLSYQKFYNSDEDLNTCLVSKLNVESVNARLMKNMNGFINLNLEIFNILGKSHPHCLSNLIEPLIYSLSISEFAISNSSEFEDDIIEKSARKNRQAGFKLLYDLTDSIGVEYNWKQYGDIMYNNLVSNKLPNFVQENLQQPSSLMKIMCNLWTIPNLNFFLYYENYAPVKSLIGLLPNPNAKESVLNQVLNFIISLIENSHEQDSNYIETLTIIVSFCLENLVVLLENSSSNEVNSKAVDILLLLVEKDFVTDNDSRKILIDSLNLALDKPKNQVDLNVKSKIIKIIGSLIVGYDCSLEYIIPTYTNISALYSAYSDRIIRTVISQLMLNLGNRFSEFELVGKLASDLNAYSTKRINEPDFEIRLNAYREINQREYKKLTNLEWLPIVHTALYFINDENDHSMRSSSSYTLIRFVDSMNLQETKEDAESYLNTLKQLILPKLKIGFRNKNELVQMEYVNVLGHIIEDSKFFNELDDMKCLLPQVDENKDADDNDVDLDDVDAVVEEEPISFFRDINDPQLHRRQKCIQQLTERIDQLSSTSIAHYILPIIEHYAFYEDDKFRNISNVTLVTIAKLMTKLTWNQFQAIFNRYLANMASNALKPTENVKKEKLRDSVRLVVSVSSALTEFTKSPPKDFPSSNSESFDKFVLNETIPTLRKVLTKREESTVLLRVPISEALTSLIMCLPTEKITAELPGILTNICHILRARSEQLRDTIRKYLSHIAVSLGVDYLRFIFKELKTALARGPQIHILSFTIHHLLLTMEPYLKHGDLGEVADMIIEVLMNDIFGTASQEKEAEGYNNKMKEIKHNKSFDTGEILAANIFLKDFGHLITPVKYLLQEKLSFKVQNRLDELLRRFSVGLQKNEESGTSDILILSYELYQQSVSFVNDNVKSLAKKDSPLTDVEDHFLVKLDARPNKTQVEYSLYINTMQKFSFELLRTAITKHDELYDVSKISDFVPVLESCVTNSNDEGVITSALKVLTLLVRIEGYADEIDAKFTKCARSTLKIIKDCPSTNQPLPQASLRFLSAAIRHRDNLQLKDNALSYVLRRVSSDLNEPMLQGVAFGLLKAMVSRHIMIAELYDTMDTVSELMITSVSNEIREVSRSVLYTFLMEYDQSRGKLEKQFKKLINNLQYPGMSGRISVLELVHLIINKSSKELLVKLSNSFFIALANVSVNDDAPTCRELAVTLITTMFSKFDKLNADLSFVERYINIWLKQNKNELLVRCGLEIFKVYISSISYEKLNKSLVENGMKCISTILYSSKRVRDDDQEDENDNKSEETGWELIYSSLNVLLKITEIEEFDDLYTIKNKRLWDNVIDSLLYPHSWIRISSSKLVYEFLKRFEEQDEKDEDEIEVDDLMVQTIVNRSFRQLGAPDISEKMSTSVARLLVLSSKRYIREDTKYIVEATKNNNSDEKVRAKKVYKSALEWVVSRSVFILKNESRQNKDMLVTKKAILNFIAYLIQLLPSESLSDILSSTLLVPIINISEQEVLVEDTDDDKSLPATARKILELVSNKLGISDYNLLFSKAKKYIDETRYERKVKRAQLALTAPDISAKRKLKKHARSREKRKNEKDENGYYRAKKKKRV